MCVVQCLFIFFIPGGIGPPRKAMGQFFFIRQIHPAIMKDILDQEDIYEYKTKENLVGSVTLI